MGNLSTQAQKASQIQNDALDIRNTATNNPGAFGIVKGSAIRLNQSALLSYAKMQKMVLDLFSNLPHISRGNMMLRIVQDSKISPHMKLPQIIQFANTYYMATQYIKDNNDFASFLSDHGVTNNNKIQTLWNKYEKAYPQVSSRGKPNLQNEGKWVRFLHDNPDLVRKSGGNLPSSIMGSQAENTNRPPIVNPDSIATQTGDISNNAPTQAPQNAGAANTLYGGR